MKSVSKKISTKNPEMSDTGKNWNIVTGCDKYSDGCLNCYANSDEHARRVSPQLRIQHRSDRGRKDHRPSDFPYRTIDGSGNNRDNPDWGTAYIQLLRLVPSDYADGIYTMAGPGRPEPRDISNAVVDQPGSILNPLGASDYLWQWGQFLDHDIGLTDGSDPPEPENIRITNRM
jgi:hypothetical protein